MYLIFDLDWTLITSHKIDIYDLLINEISKINTEKVEEARFLIKTNYSIRAKNLLEMLKLETKDIENIMQKVVFTIEELKNNFEFYPWVKDILETLSKNYKIILSTVSSDDYANTILEKAWLKKYFSLILWSTFIQKWDKHIEKMKEYFFDENFASKTIYIWDSEKDEIIAKSNNIKFIKVNTWVNFVTLKEIMNINKDFSDFWDKKWSQLKNIVFQNNFSWCVKLSKKWEKLLDIWAWSWRDSIYFASNWFQVDALDFSKVWIDIIKDFSIKNNLNINIILWDIQTFELKENNYDVIYSCNSLHYFDEETFLKIASKIEKSLKIWWCLYLRAKSINDWDYKKWEKIWNNYYKNGEDIKYYFDKPFLSSAFKNLDIQKLEYLNDLHKKINSQDTIAWFIDIIGVKK